MEDRPSHTADNEHGVSKAPTIEPDTVRFIERIQYTWGRDLGGGLESAGGIGGLLAVDDDNATTTGRSRPRSSVSG